MSPDSLFANDRGNNLYYSHSGGVIFATMLESGEDIDDDLFLVVSQPYGPPQVSIMFRNQLESLIYSHASDERWYIAKNNDEVIHPDFVEEINRPVPSQYIDYKDFEIRPSHPNFHSHLNKILPHQLPSGLHEIAQSIEFFPSRLLARLSAPYGGPGFYYVYESSDRKWLILIEYIPENYPSFAITIVPNTFYDRWSSHQNFVGWEVIDNHGNMYAVDDELGMLVREWEPGERFFNMMTSPLRNLQ